MIGTHHPSAELRRRARRAVRWVVASVAAVLLAADAVAGSASARTATTRRARVTTTRPRTVASKGAVATSTIAVATSTIAAATAPVVLQVSATELPEASGCAASRLDPRRVWLHNDSGDRARVIAVDIASGAVGPVVELPGAQTTDAEDIAMMANGDLVLADIGDNDAVRSSVRLIRFAEPKGTATQATPTTFTYRYPDGAHNAEAFVAEPGSDLGLIITKSRDGVSQVFRADLSPSDPGPTRTLTSIGTVKISGEGFLFPNLVTAADALPDGSGIVLRTYQYGYLLRRPAGQPFEATITSSPTPKRFELPFMIQGEAMCVTADGTKLVTASEAVGESTFPLAVQPASDIPR